MKTRAANQVHQAGQHVLRGVDALQVLVEQQPHHGDEDHSLGRPEVAAVDTGTGARRRTAADRRAGVPCDPPGDQPDTRGWTTTSTQASPMSTGTTARNASSGSTSSAAAPSTAPIVDAEPSRTSLARWPESGAVADGAAQRAGHQADRVADVREDRRVSHRQEHREGHQRARADHGVDGARRQPGQRDRQRLPAVTAARRRGGRRSPGDPMRATRSSRSGSAPTYQG